MGIYLYLVWGLQYFLQHVQVFGGRIGGFRCSLRSQHMLSFGLAILWKFSFEEDELFLGNFQVGSTGDLWAEFSLLWTCTGVY